MKCSTTEEVLKDFKAGGTFLKPRATSAVLLEDLKRTFSC